MARRIRAADVDDDARVHLALSQLRWLISNSGASRSGTERLRGVAGASLWHDRRRQKRAIRLETTPERLNPSASRSTSWRRRSTRQWSPFAEQQGLCRKNHSLRLQERLHGAEQIAAIPVLAQSGQVLRVQDVADVTGPDPRPEHYTRFGFGPGDPRFADWD